MKSSLGHFEELVLLTICILGDGAYGVSIKKELEGRLGKKTSVGAMQSALRRMEDKGFLLSRVGAATPERGGRKKKYFSATQHGINVLKTVQELRTQMWSAMPSTQGS